MVSRSVSTLTTGASVPNVKATRMGTSRLAVWSLILGILSLVFLLFCFGPLFAIPAVICGHKAYSQISKSYGELEGQGMAVGGLVTGYISIGISLLLIPLMAAIAIPNFVRAREVAMRNACINNLRQLEGAKAQYAIESKAASGAPVLPGDVSQYMPNGFESLKCPAGGSYTINTVGSEPTCSVAGHSLGESGSDAVR